MNVIGLRLIDLEKKIGDLKMEVAGLAIDYCKIAASTPVQKKVYVSHGTQPTANTGFKSMDEVSEQIVAILMASGIAMTVKELAKKIQETSPELLPPQIIDIHSFIFRKIRKLMKSGVDFSVREANGDRYYALRGNE